jgi:CBS domain-containing protein
VRVADIMHRDMVTVGVGETYVGAAKLLREHGISGLIVTGPAGPAGIITDRDYVNLVADGQDPASVTVGARMTTNLVTVQSDTDVRHATQLMAEHHIRHLPVVDDGKLVGVMSIRDPVAKHPALNRFELLRRQNLQAVVADRITQFAGSMPFVYVHIVWFALWIALRVEPFPFGLLTMIVSLEAIFLSTFVMISQNRADERRKVLADHQWELVQHEEYQNEELLRLSQRILNLTTEVHKLTVDTTARR